MLPGRPVGRDTYFSESPGVPGGWQTGKLNGVLFQHIVGLKRCRNIETSQQSDKLSGYRDIGPMRRFNSPTNCQTNEMLEQRDVSLVRQIVGLPGYRNNETARQSDKLSDKRFVVLLGSRTTWMSDCRTTETSRQSDIPVV